MIPHLAGTPVLETARLTLRAPGPQDWEAWRAFALSDRARFVRAPDISGALAWRAMGHLIGHWVLRGFGSFVYCLKGTDRAIGHAGPWFPATWPEREIGWTVWDPEAEGKGYAFEAARATIAHAFGPLGWDTAVSYIDQENARSIALAERLGARPDPDARPNEPGLLVFRHPRPENPA
jgi:RimJ/RimL family protein N-acetyltransferase